jgi:hypothetical protein
MIVTESSLNCDGNYRRCLISHGSQESVRRGCSSRRSGNVTENLISRRSVTGVPSARRVSPLQILYPRDGIYRSTQNPHGASLAEMSLPLTEPCSRNGIYRPVQNHQRDVFSAEPSLPSSVRLRIPCPWDGISAEPSLPQCSAVTRSC